MKIELKKETSFDGVWYIITVDGRFKTCKRDIIEAAEIYDNLILESKLDSTCEILKSIEL